MTAPVPNPFDLMFAGVVLFVLLIVVVFLLLRIRWLLTRRGFQPTYGALGNAFQEVQRIALPQIEYVLDEQHKDTKQENNDGGRDKTGRHSGFRGQ